MPHKPDPKATKEEVKEQLGKVNNASEAGTIAEVANELKDLAATAQQHIQHSKKAAEDASKEDLGSFPKGFIPGRKGKGLSR